MKSNPFNICPTCKHVKTCVLTSQKNQVWSCSEYEEVEFENLSYPKKITNKNVQQKMIVS